MQNFLDLGAYFYLSLITDKLSGGSPCPDLVLKCVDELPVSINICNERLHTNENLGNGGYLVYSGCIQVDGIGSNQFLPLMDIKSRERRPILLLEEGGHRQVSILGGYFKGLLD